MEYSRLDFTAAGAANDFCSYIFEPYFRKKNILSTIFSHAAVTTLILFLIIILPCFVRTPLQSTQKLATELHLADLKNKKREGCQEPPREIPPMTKVMQRRPDRQRQSRTQGIPWTCSSICPKTKICLSAVYYIMPFTNSFDINRGLSPTTFL